MNETYSQGQPYKKPYYQPSKGTEIRKAMDRKETSIRNFTDNKEAAIVVTSSINNAAEWCVRHPNWKKLANDAERWMWVDSIAKEFITYFASNKEDFETLYWGLKKRTEEIRFKVEEGNDIEQGSDEFEPAPEIDKD